LKKLLALLLVLVLVAGLVACNTTPAEQTPTPTPAATPTPPANGGEENGEEPDELRVIQLGGLAPITGGFTEFGQGFDAAWHMAIEDINARGGTSNGYTFEITVVDSRGEPGESAALASRFAEDQNILAILGDFSSGACMAAAPIVDEAGIVLISPTASAPAFAPMSDWTFGIMGLQSGEAPWYARQIVQRYIGAETVAVIHLNTDWGVASFNYFELTAYEIGLEIVEVVDHAEEEMDFSALVSRMRAADPDLVVILGQGTVADIINSIRGVGWDVPISALGPGTSAQIIELAGENAEGLIVPTPFFFDPLNPALVAWADRFESVTGFAPTVHPATAYDTMMLIARAVEMIGDGEVTREAIRDNLAIIDDVVGITGHIRFNPTGDLFREYLIAGVQNGEWVLLEDFGFADR